MLTQFSYREEHSSLLDSGVITPEASLKTSDHGANIPMALT